MRGTVAKKLRKLIYKGMSSRNTYDYSTNPYTQQNICIGARNRYITLKQIYKGGKQII